MLIPIMKISDDKNKSNDNIIRNNKIKILRKYQNSAA